MAHSPRLVQRFEHMAVLSSELMTACIAFDDCADKLEANAQLSRDLGVGQAEFNRLSRSLRRIMDKDFNSKSDLKDQVQAAVALNVAAPVRRENGFVLDQVWQETEAAMAHLPAVHDPNPLPVLPENDQTVAQGSATAMAGSSADSSKEQDPDPSAEEPARSQSPGSN